LIHRPEASLLEAVRISFFISFYIKIFLRMRFSRRKIRSSE
jgi:hypothetical protein